MITRVGLQRPDPAFVVVSRVRLSSFEKPSATRTGRPHGVRHACRRPRFSPRRLAGERSLAVADCPVCDPGRSVKLAEASHRRFASPGKMGAPSASPASMRHGLRLPEPRRRRTLSRWQPGPGPVRLAGGFGVRLVKDPRRPGSARPAFAATSSCRMGGLASPRPLVAEGMARVHPFVDETICLGPLFAAERSARKMQQGIWAKPRIRHKGRQMMLRLFGQNGPISTGRGSGGLGRCRVAALTFIDFGRDWGRDFTVMLTPSWRRI